MRKAVFNAVKAIVPPYSVGNVGTTVKKPYAFLKFGTPIKTTLGNYTVFNVTIYVDKGDTVKLDTLCDSVIKALNNVRLARISDGSSFIPEFTGETDDFPDDDLSALGKGLSFRVPRFGNDYM